MDISLDNLEITRGGFHLAANMDISDGITAIIGPSGGGKSSLLLAISGFLDSTKGQIKFAGQIETRNPGDRPVTILFQENNLFPHMTVAQNVGLGIDPTLRLSSANKVRVDKALDNVGLTGYSDKYPANLSGGQRQRVAIARALLRNKPVLLLDEPFAALGPALRHEMLDLIRSLRDTQQTNILLVTHSPEDAKRIADNIILVADHVAHPPMETAKLFANPPEALRNYLGA